MLYLLFVHVQQVEAGDYRLWGQHLQDLIVQFGGCGAQLSVLAVVEFVCFRVYAIHELKSLHLFVLLPKTSFAVLAPIQ